MGFRRQPICRPTFYLPLRLPLPSPPSPASSPLRDFHVLGFSLAYELGGTNVLDMCRQAGIPVSWQVGWSWGGGRGCIHHPMRKPNREDHGMGGGLGGGSWGLGGWVLGAGGRAGAACGPGRALCHSACMSLHTCSC